MLPGLILGSTQTVGSAERVALLPQAQELVDVVEEHLVVLEAQREVAGVDWSRCRVATAGEAADGCVEDHFSSRSVADASGTHPYKTTQSYAAEAGGEVLRNS